MYLIRICYYTSLGTYPKGEGSLVELGLRLGLGLGLPNPLLH